MDLTVAQRAFLQGLKRSISLSFNEAPYPLRGWLGSVAVGQGYQVP